MEINVICQLRIIPYSVKVRRYFIKVKHLYVGLRNSFVYINKGNILTFLTVSAQGSSVYMRAPYFGDYSAYWAVDGQLSPGNSGFYHSSLEPYPSLKISFVKADQITPVDTGITLNRVEIYQRCDANELYHHTSFEIRGAHSPGEIYRSPELVGGEICATTTQGFATGGIKFTVACTSPLENITEVWIQKTNLHSHGAGWPGFNGNRWNSWSGNSAAKNTNILCR